ncbi:MAG: hypothetical protein V3V18_06405 [Methylococcales bacterium]
MKYTTTAYLVAIGIGLIILLKTCGSEGPSQSLSDIQSPEESLSNRPTATSEKASRKGQ